MKLLKAVCRYQKIELIASCYGRTRRDEESVHRAAREERGLSPQRAVPPRGRANVQSAEFLQELSATTGMDVEHMIYLKLN